MDRPVATPDVNLSPENSSSAAYEASRVVKAAPGVLYAIEGYNSGAAQFLQIHDAAALPADTAVPLLTLAIAATSNFSLNLGTFGLACRTGIVICNSSTGPTKTIGAANVFMTVRFK